MYLELDQFVWWQWLCGCKKSMLLSWSIFIDELIEHYGDIKRNTLFNQLIYLRQRGILIDHIKETKKLSIQVKNILEDNLLISLWEL